MMSLENLHPQSADAAKELARHEKAISTALKGFRKIGKALTAIREQELYKVKGYGTFEAYCRKEWEFTDERARQYRKASALVDYLESEGSFKPLELPARASHAQELLDVPEDQLVAVWNAVLEAAGDGRIKAKLIRKVRNQLLEDHEDQKPKTKQKNENAPSLPEGFSVLLPEDAGIGTPWEGHLLLTGSDTKHEALTEDLFDVITAAAQAGDEKGMTPLTSSLCGWTWSPISSSQDEESVALFASKATNRNALIPARLGQPARTSIQADQDPHSKCVLVCSDADLFDSVNEEWAIRMVLSAIRQMPTWTFIVHTRHLERLARVASKMGSLPRNLMVGTSAATVAEANRAVSHLKEVDGAMTWLRITSADALKAHPSVDWLALDIEEEHVSLEDVGALGAMRHEGTAIHFLRELRVSGSEWPAPTVLTRAA